MEETARDAIDRLPVRTLHSVRARVGNLSGGRGSVWNAILLLAAAMDAVSRQGVNFSRGGGGA